jgi:5-amino-6-(5-phosphoribosylamino)uracil reductase
MQIVASMAASLDGKLSPANLPHYVRISSREDIRRLRLLRDSADAILIGGETFRAYPKAHPGSRPGYYPRHCLMTRTWKLPNQAPMFDTIVTEDLPPALIFSPVAPPDSFHQPEGSFEWVPIGNNDAPPTEIVAQVCQYLENQHCRQLLIEGGGDVVSLFLQAKALQTLHLTLCPLLIGGANSPCLVSGTGFLPGRLPRTRIESLEHVGDEIFLRLSVDYNHLAVEGID